MPVVARTSCRVAGYRGMVTKGRVYEDNDPIVKARPELFEEPADHARKAATPKNTKDLGKKSMSSRKRKKRAPVEQATAAPGEKRATKRKKGDDDS